MCPWPEIFFGWLKLYHPQPRLARRLLDADSEF